MKFLEHRHVLGPAPLQQPDGSCCVTCPDSLAEGIRNKLYSDPCFVAASHGHLHCLQKAATYGYIFLSAYQAAARRGSLQCLQFLCETRHYPTFKEPSVCNCAIWGGHLECLMYLLDHPDQQRHKVLHKEMCASAAAAGQLECLLLLRERKCPWDHTTCMRAACAGQYECLFYSVEQGCPWWPGKIDDLDSKCLVLLSALLLVHWKPYCLAGAPSRSRLWLPSGQPHCMCS